MGLNGVILVAYIVAIPANEIVIPTILMLTLTLGSNIVGAKSGVILDLDTPQIYTVLTQIGVDGFDRRQLATVQFAP